MALWLETFGRISTDIGCISASMQFRKDYMLVELG